MEDTSFHVPAQKIDRLHAFHFFNRQANGLDLFDDVANSDWQNEPPSSSRNG
jgi:hypothetical protein